MKLIKTPPEVSSDFGKLVSRRVMFLCEGASGSKFWEIGEYVQGWEDEDPYPHWVTNAGFNLECKDVLGWIELPKTE